jgi:hypothetical protein
MDASTRACGNSTLDTGKRLNGIPMAIAILDTLSRARLRATGCTHGPTVKCTMVVGSKG